MLSSTFAAVGLLSLWFSPHDSPLRTPIGPPPAPRAAPRKPVVRVPIHPNSTCPVMGKPISKALRVDVARGRIWLCCKGCRAQVLADPEAAWNAAYPTVRPVGNERCPVTGRALDERAVEVTVQGRSFRVADATAAEAARRAPQRTLAKALEPQLVEVGNLRCPIDGQPVAEDAFVVVDDRIVRLSREEHVAAIEAEPERAGLR
ncbi:MAG: hypothetical protein JNL90_21410 [Planctomycetes bacterium]|nr:hypothetical protein [Planctomycetota bacterium]